METGGRLGDKPEASLGEGHPAAIDEVTWLDLYVVLHRKRRLVALVVGVVFLLAAIVAFLRPTVFSARVAFVSNNSVAGSLSGALALARQFGVSVGQDDSQRSPAFYEDLLRSNDIVRQTVTGPYWVVNELGDTSTISLVDYYDVDEETADESVELAMERFREDLATESDAETGIVRFSIGTRDPQLSVQIASRLYSLIDQFELSTRQAQARAERQFAGGRLARLTDELSASEDSLKDFLSENRSFANSPPLQFEHDRLQRLVIMRQELVTTMTQAFENARIEEVRNTSSLSLITTPRRPARADPRGRLLILGVGFVLGFTLGVFAALLDDFMRSDRRLRGGEVTA